MDKKADEAKPVKVSKTIYTDTATWGRVKALSKSSGLKMGALVQRALENVTREPAGIAGEGAMDKK